MGFQLPSPQLVSESTPDFWLPSTVASCCNRFFPFHSAAPQRICLPRPPNQSILHLSEPQGKGPKFLGDRFTQKYWQYKYMYVYYIHIYIVWNMISSQYHKYVYIYIMVVYHMYCIILCIVDTGYDFIYDSIWFRKVCSYMWILDFHCKSILRNPPFCVLLACWASSTT